VVTWVLDALLAAAYLKWFHPWKIILQEEPDKWELEEEFEGAGVSQVVEQVEVKNTAEDVLGLTAAEEQEDSPHLDSTGPRTEEKMQLQNCSQQVEEEPQVAEELLDEESGEEDTEVEDVDEPQVAEEKFLEEESEEEDTKVWRTTCKRQKNSAV